MRPNSLRKQAEPKPTIVTVAEQAGVAISTVSRYLNGDQVSQATKQRISRVIDRLGYIRSSTARNLSLGRKGCIGVVVDSTSDPWFVQLLAGIEQELALHDSSVMLATLAPLGLYDANVVFRWIAERRVDGIIIAGSRRRERALLQSAVAAKLPCVEIAPQEGESRVPIVRCNNIAAGALVADHLTDLGHRRIRFVGGPENSLDSKQRLQGLRDRLTQLGIRFSADASSFCGSYEAAAGIEFARIILAKPLDFTALVMANDALALGFMRIAQQRGIRIPQALSVVGFDNVPEGALVWPGLTTVAQPMREMGRAACRTLFQAIAAPVEINAIEYPMTLVVRESTGPAAD